MNNLKGELANVSGLAGKCGVSRNTVLAWVRRGCPVIQKGDKAAGKDWQFDTAAVDQWRIDEAVEKVSKKLQKPESVEDTNIFNLEKRKLLAETILAETKAALAKGEVASLDEIERQWSGFIMEIRARLRQVPQRVASQLLGVNDEKEIKAILADEIDEALLAIANQGEQE